jgi:hypothetical protein
MIILSQDSDILKDDDVGMVQVHGNMVSVVSKKDAGKYIENCDGLVTNDPGIALKIFTADCLPVAIFDPVKNSIALVHAGWRGLSKKIISEAINSLQTNFSSKPESLIVEIGPHICQKHYEIKEDTAVFFKDYPTSLERKDDKIYLDLEKVAELQLSECGVTAHKINSDGRCTFEDISLPSFRRGDMQKDVSYRLRLPKSP